MTTQYNAVRGIVAAGGTGNVTLSSNPAGKGQSPSIIPVGWSGGIRFDDPLSSAWSLEKCTMLTGLILQRDTVLAGSSGAGTKINLPAGTIALQTLLAEDSNAFLTSASGMPIPTYLAANPGSTLTGSDTILAVQGSAVVGESVSALATFAIAQYPAGKVAAVRITSAGTVPLDSTTHNRRRIIVTVAGVTLTGPGSYGSIGDDFECEVYNLSAGVVTFGTGFNVVPSGTTLAVGGHASVFSSAGALYASLGAAAAPDTVAPTAQSAAVANAAPTVVVITMSEAMDSGNVPAASAFTVSGHTVSSVAISGNKINLTCSTAFVNGEAARTVAYTQPGTANARDLAQNLLANFSNLAITNNVVAVGGGGGGSVAPFTATARTGFPITFGTFAGDSSSFLWSDIAATGAATVTSVVGILSTSNTVAPTTAIAAPNGHSLGTLTGTTAPYVPGGSLINFGVATPTNFYYWMLITDSTGSVWNFVHTAPISFGDGVAVTRQTSVTPYTQVQS